MVVLLRVFYVLRYWIGFTRHIVSNSRVVVGPSVPVNLVVASMITIVQSYVFRMVLIQATDDYGLQVQGI